MAQMVEPPPRPGSLTEYFDWAKEALGFDLQDAHVKRCYELTLLHAQNVLQESVFYEQLGTLFSAFASEYETQNGTELFMQLRVPDFETKPYQSAVEKSYRKNVLSNSDWPNQPQGAWISPENWFGRLNDIVRTIVVCKFIDGPEFVCERLRTWSEENNYSVRFDPQQSDAGYYAYHFYVTLPVSVLVPEDGAKNRIVEQNMEFEIQFTTQFQEVLRILTHPYYEKTRLERPGLPDKWKWEHGSDRFRSGYMGHTLHLLEAIILELRNNNLEEKHENGNA